MYIIHNAIQINAKLLGLYGLKTINILLKYIHVDISKNENNNYNNILILL